MANGTRGTRSVAIALTLVVGLAAGWLVGCGKEPGPPPMPTPVPTATSPPLLAPTCPPTNAYTITVGPNSGDIKVEPSLGGLNGPLISKSQGTSVTWVPSDKSTMTNLVITFDVSGFPPEAGGQPPFLGGQANAPQVFQCTSSTPCAPQGVNDKLNLPDCPGNLYFKYKATWKVGGTDRQVDAGIIIEK